MLVTNEELLWPVDTKEQFVYRYRWVAGGTFTTDEVTWMELVFNKFSSGKVYWTENDFASFILASVPEEVASEVKDAVPILYRWFLRAGCYPHHDQPEQYISLDILRVAVSSLLRRDDMIFRRPELYPPSEEYVRKHAHRFRRLLFQYLSVDSTSSSSTRADAEDEDIVDAIEIIEWRRTITLDPDRPIYRRTLPEPRTAEYYPSSRSASLDDGIPVAELKLLCKLLLACQLCLSGIGPEAVFEDKTRFDESLDSLMTVFGVKPSENASALVCWLEFEKALKQDVPHLFGIISRLASSFVNPRGVTHDDFATLDRDGIVSKLRSASSSDTRPDDTTAKYGYPLLAQMTTFLPQIVDHYRRHPARIRWPNITSAQALKDILSNQPGEHILLVTGSIDASSTSGSSQTRDRSTVVYGVYFPALQADPLEVNRLGPPFIFQCIPHQQVHRGSGKLIAQTTATGGLQFETGDASLTLHLDGSLAEGKYGEWIPTDENQETKKLIIRDVSVLDIDDDRVNDLRFHSSSRPE